MPDIKKLELPFVIVTFTGIGVAMGMAYWALLDANKTKGQGR